MLFQLDIEKYVFVFKIHHIITDFWSLDILYREITCIYNAIINGKSYDLPPLSMSYVDYAKRERKVLQKGEIE
ncbi:Linear gramicidin synthase subunit B [compost metagenome]